MASIGYVVYVFPLDKNKIDSVYDSLNPVLKESCDKKTASIIRSGQFEFSGAEAKSPEIFAKDSVGKFHVLISWLSDDSGMKGVDFYDGRDGAKTCVEQSIGAKTVGIFSFLVSLGLDEYLQEIFL